MSNIRVNLLLLNIVSMLRNLYLYRIIRTINTLIVYPKSTMSLYNDILMDSSPVLDIVARCGDRLKGVAQKPKPPSVRKGLNLPAILAGPGITFRPTPLHARSSHGFTPRKCHVDGICASFSALHRLILRELPFNGKIKVNRGTVVACAPCLIGRSPGIG